MNTNNLKNFASFLRNEVNKITDALFVENLIAEIEKRDKLTKEVVERWLKSAFNFPANYEQDNCFDTYNRSFFNQIMEKI